MNSWNRLILLNMIYTILLQVILLMYFATHSVSSLGYWVGGMIITGVNLCAALALKWNNEENNQK